MIDDKSILELVTKQIESEEKLDDQTGGSGHLANVSYELKEHTLKKLSDTKYEIHYRYIKYIETEFTYYPDNPPYEEIHKMIMTIDENGNVISNVRV